MKNKLKVLFVIFISFFMSADADCSELLVLEKQRAKSSRTNKVLMQRNILFSKELQTNEGLLKVVKISDSEDP